MVCQTVRDKATQSVGQEVDVFQGVSCGPAEAKESMGSPVRIVDVRWINARLGQYCFASSSAFWEGVESATMGNSKKLRWEAVQMALKEAVRFSREAR